MNKPIPVFAADAAAGAPPIGYMIEETARAILRDVGDVVQVSFAYTIPEPNRPEPKAIYVVSIPAQAAERTSAEVASLAAKGLADPASLSPDEIKSVCASALTQPEPDRIEVLERPLDPSMIGPGAPRK